MECQRHLQWHPDYLPFQWPGWPGVRDFSQLQLGVGRRSHIPPRGRPAKGEVWNQRMRRDAAHGGGGVSAAELTQAAAECATGRYRTPAEIPPDHATAGPANRADGGPV